MVHIKTLPYPGFATDLQQPLTPLLLKASGDGTIIDTIYPKRVNHIPELRRMGANAKVESDMIFMQGPNKLTGAEVTASDLRAGACLVIAGLMAEGTTTISVSRISCADMIISSKNSDRFGRRHQNDRRRRINFSATRYKSAPSKQQPTLKVL